MDAFIKRPLVRQIPPPGFESCSSGGATMHTNLFSFDLDTAPPYSTASSWSISGGDMGRRTHPFSFGHDIARPPISLSDLCDDYFPRPAQFGPFPTMNVPHNDYVPAVGELPALPVPPAGFNPTPAYDYGNPFDADGRAALAMDVPAPWDPCYDDGHVVQLGIEEPVSVSSAAPVCDGAGTLNDDNSMGAPPKLCCPYDGFDEDIEATLRAQEDEAKAKPSPDYLETTQGGRMSQDTRATLVGWMKRFTQCYGLAPGTLHRAVSYADRFLSVQQMADVGMHRLRLLGAVAVYAAAKYEDQGTVELLDAAEIASYCSRCGGGRFTSSKEEVLDMERTLLAALDYRLGRPTAYTFVEHFTRHYGEEELRLELRSCAHDFVDMSLFHYSCLQHNPSAVAAAAMFLARLTLKPTYGQMKSWNRELKELTGYEPIKLERCVEAIHSLIPHHGDGSYDDVDLFPMFYAIADPK
ncbi:putative cyclin-F2-1 [Miscanthus floridulus]|uniref:putative cyclin-F2-1 n=1 Tax=Miscanthus floridulus TaxID=154761 RepID=UPI0034594F86